MEGLLRELELSHLPTLRVLNKTDLLPVDHVADLARRLEAAPVSAVNREGLPGLIATAEERLGLSLHRHRQATP